jgi:hypothetical protein
MEKGSACPVAKLFGGFWKGVYPVRKNSPFFELVKKVFYKAFQKKYFK